jgi:hypothetical protein
MPCADRHTEHHVTGNQGLGDGKKRCDHSTRQGLGKKPGSTSTSTLISTRPQDGFHKFLLL